jgi:hypothetical protein
VTMTNTLLANDTGGDFAGNAAANTSSNNLIQVDNGSGLGSSNGNITNAAVTNVGLDPSGLQKNGGPTQTIALLPGRQTIHAGTNSVLPSADQRGVTRTTNNVDIGAYQTLITLSPASLPVASVGNSYSQTMTASGGTSPYTFSTTSGALPSGFTLSPGGILSGVSNVAGTYTFVVAATDSSGSPGPLRGSQIYKLVFPPTIIPSTANVYANVTTLTINGAGFDPTAANNTVTLSSGTGTVSAATPTQLTLTFTSAAPSVGPLTAIVTTNGAGSGAAVQVATIRAVPPTITPSTVILNANVTTLTINGTGFDPTAANNTVTLSSGTGTVSAATTAQLTVTLTTAPSVEPLTAIVTTDGAGSGTAVQVATIVPVGGLLNAIPAGPEFQVNTTASGTELFGTQAAASDAAGDYVIVWIGDAAGVNGNIFARLYNSAGVPQGNEFRANATLNPTPSASPDSPAVAMDGAGDFMVVWEKSAPPGKGYFFDIVARRFNASGTPQGSEFQVDSANNGSVGGGAVPAVAMDANGNATIVWTTTDYDPGIFNGLVAIDAIYAQSYNAAGQPVGGNFRMSAHRDLKGIPAIALNPALAQNAAGDLVVTWTGRDQIFDPYGANFSLGIYAKRYHSGTAGAEFLANTTVIDHLDNSKVVIDPAGEFVIAWNTIHPVGPDEMLGQGYGASGTARGTEFTITDQSSLPFGLAMDISGNFVAAWEDNSGLISARKYASDGTPHGSVFRVNASPDTSGGPALAADPAGDFVVAWDGTRGDGTAQVTGFFGQRFAANLSTISGTMFQDINLNGVQDPGEPGIAGQTVFLDLSGSGTLEARDPTATTDSNGKYQITGVGAGSYTVRQVLLGGVLLDSPASGSYKLTVSGGANLTGQNFADVPTSITVPLTLSPTTPFPKQGTANADFVEALYRAILDRNADPGGLAAWTGLLTSRAMSRLQVAQGIRQSQEHFQQEVTDFYMTMLGRAPDPAGLQSWVNILGSGQMTEEQVAVGFLDSQEYLNKGDKYFVDHMYLSLLGRTFDSNGEQHWLNVLGDDATGKPTHAATMTHVQVIGGFLNSQESLTRLVQGYYQVFLQRLADPAGLSDWLTLLGRGGSFLTIGQGFLSSQEFYNNAAAQG